MAKISTKPIGIIRFPTLSYTTFKLIVLVYSRRSSWTSQDELFICLDRLEETRKQRWLRTFLLQQCYPFLAQLVLPRLLAPDLPWTCYSRLGLKVSHSKQLLEAVVDTDSHLFRHCLFEKFSLLLPTLAVNAVSHAFSPEPNPNSPLSVIATVVQYTTVNSW